MPRKRKTRNKKLTGKTSIESKVALLLRDMHYPYEEQVVIDKYTVDFLVDKKYIVECYGDFWHCNPHQYTSSYYNRGKKKTAEEIWKRDAERKKTFEGLGYKFICLWESEIKEDIPIVRKRLKRIIKKIDK